MINGVSGTLIQMNGGKGKNFLTQAPKAQNRRVIFSPSPASKCKIETS